jgi:hypothetical protein
VTAIAEAGRNMQNKLGLCLMCLILVIRKLSIIRIKYHVSYKSTKTTSCEAFIAVLPLNQDAID